MITVVVGKENDMAYSNARNIKSCIAWKEIVPPELKESE